MAIDEKTHKLVSEHTGTLLTYDDRQKAIENARRRAVRRVEEREHLRLELKAREYIHTIHGIVDTLKAGEETDRDGEVWRLSKERIQALKAAGDMSLRMLDRVLPPLKAVEIQDSPEKQANAAQLTTGELLRLVLREQREGAEVAEFEEVPRHNGNGRDDGGAPWD